MNRLCFLLCWLLPILSRADHVIGGDVSLQLIDRNRPGYYRIQVIQYWETAKLSSGNADLLTKVAVFRKRDHALIREYQLTLRITTPLLYDNAACSQQRSLGTTQAVYYADYQFDLNDYTDSEGYYIVWERCCRNSAMINLASASVVGMMLYLEFPALSRNGVPVLNSSPVFSTPNGAYICVNRPFSFLLNATDTDGDQLRYSLVTPYEGYTTKALPFPVYVSHTTYPLVTWQAGFSVQNAIPGTPPLQVDPVTGRLTVRATRSGIYLFSVQVEEFRNGVRIGLTRRDFQLPVIDCSTDRIPPAVITLDSLAVTTVNWCGNTPPVLAVDDQPQWAYQWQKDGVNLLGMTGPAFSVSEPGDYTVVKSAKGRCTNDTVSQIVQVRRVAAPAVSLSVSGPRPTCTGDTMLLTASTVATGQYNWQQDGQRIAGNNSTRLRVSQSGWYRVLVRLPTYTCAGQDSMQVTINPIPVANLGANKLLFCLGDSARLTVGGVATYQYKWTLDRVPLSGSATQTIQARQGGRYQVIVTAPSGCSAVSEVISLTSTPAPVLTLNAVPASCPEGPLLTLSGLPAGGIFTGPGVQGQEFNPKQAGPGQHQITYRLQTAAGCQSEQIRQVVVWPGPGLVVPPVYSVARADTVKLLAKAARPDVQFRWEPPRYLSDPATAAPIARPDESITYRVIATSEDGCLDTATVVVNVTERLNIPSAFSPNGDGVNDVWVIRHLAAFPSCEVIVYNRWGEIVFASTGYAQPWDGRSKSDRIMAGIYTYRITVEQGGNEYHGRLTILE